VSGPGVAPVATIVQPSLLTPLHNEILTVLLALAALLSVDSPLIASVLLAHTAPLNVNSPTTFATPLNLSVLDGVDASVTAQVAARTAAPGPASVLPDLTAPFRDDPPTTVTAPLTTMLTCVFAPGIITPFSAARGSAPPGARIATTRSVCVAVTAAAGAAPAAATFATPAAATSVVTDAAIRAIAMPSSAATASDDGDTRFPTAADGRANFTSPFLPPAPTPAAAAVCRGIPSIPPLAEKMRGIP